MSSHTGSGSTVRNSATMRREHHPATRFARHSRFSGWRGGLRRRGGRRCRRESPELRLWRGARMAGAPLGVAPARTLCGVARERSLGAVDAGAAPCAVPASARCQRGAAPVARASPCQRAEVAAPVRQPWQRRRRQRGSCRRWASVASVAAVAFVSPFGRSPSTCHAPAQPDAPRGTTRASLPDRDRC